MNKKIVITICREFGSEGHEIGKILSERLNIPLYDKDLLVLAAKESGEDMDRLASADEKVSTRFLSNYLPLSGDLLNDRLFKIESQLIRQIYEKDKACIIVGRLSDYILKDEDDCLKVLITAPFEERAEIIRKKHSITMDAARKVVKKMDEARRSYYSYYSNGKWSHESEKDLILDRSTFGIEGCVNIIESAIKQLDK